MKNELIKVLILFLFALIFYGFIFITKVEDCEKKGAEFISVNGAGGFCVKDGKIVSNKIEGE